MYHHGLKMQIKGFRKRICPTFQFNQRAKIDDEISKFAWYITRAALTAKKT